MNNTVKAIGISMAIFALLFAACGKESTTEPEPESDLEAIQWLIEENPRYFNTQSHYGNEDTTGGSFSICTPVIHYFWYREIDPNPDIHVEIDIVGDSAFISWTGEFTGTFHLFASDTFPPDTIIEYLKEFQDFGTRYAIFKRLYPSDEDPLGRRGWRLFMISGAEIISQGNTVHIDSIRLNCASYPDSVITDPLAMFSKDDIVTLTPEERCSLTVYTNSGNYESEYVFLHSWRRNIEHHRHRFTHLGNGIYTGVWFAPINSSSSVNIVHHCAFDMIENKTLDDDVAPYDAHGWLFPYIVVPTF
jgi:hypothetical protein